MTRPLDPGLAGPPDPTAVPVRTAATVMLLRDAPRGPEVFTLQRVSAMVFAAGMTVFPGGGVDATDAEAVPWTGPGPSWWASQWHVAEEQARTVVVTAVRELFEETGVLLATAGADGREVEAPDTGASDDAASGDAGSGDTASGTAHSRTAHSRTAHSRTAHSRTAHSRTAHSRTAHSRTAHSRTAHSRTVRDGLAAHRYGLGAVLRPRGLAVDAGALRPWARWITPVGPPRRYDTFFFAAALPVEQHPDSATSEAAGGGWHRPADLLEAGAAGRIGLMPPTISALTDLAAAGSAADVLAETRVLQAISPSVVTADGEVLHLHAAGRDYRTRLRWG